MVITKVIFVAKTGCKKGKIVQKPVVFLISPQLSQIFHSDKKFLPSCFLLHYSLNFMNSWQVATAIPSLYRVWTLAISSGDRLTSHVLVHIAGLFLDIKAQQVLVV